MLPTFPEGAMPDDLAGHPAFRRLFMPGRMTLGMMFPMEPLLDHLYPRMDDQIALAKKVDDAGFGALWFRDVPLYDPEFGDVGQVFDVWVWLATIAAHTKNIALSTGAMVLPLRHPLHTAKAAASLDILSGGRFILGAASGDRAIEYEAFNQDHDTRDETFREHVSFYRKALEECCAEIENSFGHLTKADLTPKPQSQRIPLLIVGMARQTLQWIADNADGWVTYPRDPLHQKDRIFQWNQRTPGVFKPFSQSLFIDLTDDPDIDPEPIFLGYRLGRNRLLDILKTLESQGVHHLFFNLRKSHRPAAEVIDELTETILPHFPAGASVPVRSMQPFPPDGGHNVTRIL